ncbi:uncharacterized protein LOC144110777 [Amblyomma americanum]
MDHFIQHATRRFSICCLLWNVAHSYDFETFEEKHKRLKEEVESAHRNFDRSFNTVRVVVPVVMGMLFVLFCVIFCCISYRRRQRFWEMQQQQQHHVPPPLGLAPGPGPVTSGAITYSYSHGNPPIPRAVAPPTPAAPYPPQPAGAYPWGGPYTNLNNAPSSQPYNATATPWPCAPPPPPYSGETKQLL